MILLFWRRRQYVYSPSVYGTSLMTNDTTPSTGDTDAGAVSPGAGLHPALGGTSEARAPMMGGTGLTLPPTHAQMEDR